MTADPTAESVERLKEEARDHDKEEARHEADAGTHHYAHDEKSMRKSEEKAARCRQKASDIRNALGRLQAAEQECGRLSKSPWITDEGFRDAEDLLDMGRVGRSLMERIEDVRRTPGYEHWMPADDPAEIVFDLINELADQRARAEAALSAVPPSQGGEKLQQELDREEAAHGQTVDQRDEAEEALSRAYFLVTGKSPEWSNMFGHADALEEIDETVAVLKLAVRAPEPRSNNNTKKESI